MKIKKNNEMFNIERDPIQGYFEMLKFKRMKEAMDAGFTEKQAEYLIKKLK